MFLQFVFEICKSHFNSTCEQLNFTRQNLVRLYLIVVNFVNFVVLLQICL